ncbi:MAG: glycosyltransferase family 2 protein [Myxococcota bacterium]
MRTPSFQSHRALSHIRRSVADEISRVSRYCDEVLQCFPLAHDRGELLSRVDCDHKRVVSDLDSLPGPEPERRRLVLLNGSLNHDFDVQATLGRLLPFVHRGDRIALVLYNPYLRGLYRAANRLGIREGEAPSTFITHSAIENLAAISGYEVVRSRPAGFVPTRVLAPLNRVLGALAGVRELSLARVVFLRPSRPAPTQPSLSVVVPARNERGNIENALKGLRPLNAAVDLEVIFVEGHSSDGTWEEIERVVGAYGDEFQLKMFRQSGKGKNDAVRLGFAHASKDLLTILDADLTMPPTMLKRFYDAYTQGRGDFINGSRLVYPMEGEAMRFLNHLGNVFFAKALSAVLENPLSDSLCGTKLLARRDYERVVAWRQDFGDFDPFGDFELLFAASVLAMGTVDVPVRYLARTYGSTNISRFRHGLELLRMTAIGASRVRSGAG